MPKRSERAQYARSFAKGNPYQGANPKTMYKRLRWGNHPNSVFDIEAPEPMVALGEVAKLRGLKRVLAEYAENEGPYLVVGRDSNLLYIVPRYNDGAPMEVPAEGYRPITKLRGVDYFSDKGGEVVYYYHDHEKPYPLLMQHPSGVCFLEPAIMGNGGRSYVVDDAGIIG